MTRRSSALWFAAAALPVVVLTLATGARLSGTATPPAPAALPATVVRLPDVPGANAIWGATGQDAAGHIWFGISTGGTDPKSAHLIEYNPTTAAAVDRGNVIAELTRLGLARTGEQQAKIHSKIVEGPGGWLYFASMDEDGENANGSRLPTWGGHLWRLSRSTGRWQHLLRVPEATIAVGVGTRFVYSLAYFGHVLYQYDTQTARTARIEVGSVDGHISRNLLVDRRDHVYVPRLTRVAGTGAATQVRVSLVEFGPDLKELKATPLATADYLGGESPTGAHGIVGLQPMADGSIAFTTHPGRLFRVIPPVGAAGAATAATAAEIVNVGMVHPRGSSYPASLFTSDGRSMLATLAKAPDSGQWEWVSCQWPVLSCRTAPLEVTGFDAGTTHRMLLYGSATRDAAGGHYLVGMGPGYKPIVLRLTGDR